MALRGLGCFRFALHNNQHAAKEAALRLLLQSSCFKCTVGAKRCLLSESVVRLQEFQQKKLEVAQQVPGSKSQFFDAVNQKMEKKELILKDELKLLLLLCQSPDDMVTARNAIYRYHEENYNMAFGEFRFGPLFIRLCYELGLEDLAVATLIDKRLKGFFQDCTSFNIAIDLLFTKERFEGALNLVKEMKTQGVAFNKDTITLAFATCYKLNTPMSYQICLGLLEEGQTMGSVIPRHAYCIAVAFALQQDDLEQAQSIYSQIMNTDSRLCQNIRVLLLARAGSIKNVVSILRTAMMSNSSALVKKPDFCQEVLDVLKERSQEGPWKLQVEQLVRQLQQMGQVNIQSLDHLLCRTPAGKKRFLAGLDDGRRRTTSRRTLRPLLSE